MRTRLYHESSGNVALVLLSFAGQREESMTRLLGTLISLLILCWSSAYGQQPVDPNAYHAMKWRHIGPFRGGRVTAVAGVPDRIHSFFSGAAGGGL